MTLIPIQVTFHGLPKSDALEADVRERVAWLERFYHGIVGCRVRIEVPHRHRHNGRHFHIRIELTVPGGDPIVVSQQPSLHGPLKDIEQEEHRKGTEIEAVHRYAHVALHQAFDVARRRVQDFGHEQRGAIKTHDMPAHGQVSEISPADDCGFILAGERLIYFTRASVIGDAFDELVVGTAVAFVEQEGDKGPRASSVRVLGKHHYVEP